MPAFIDLVVTLSPLPGMRNELIGLVKKLQTESAQEVGCVRYELLVAVEPDQNLYLLERWENQAALTHHQETPHFIQGVEGINACTSSVVIKQIDWV